MYTIHPLAVGFNETDQGIMTYQRYYGRRIILPIYTFAIKGGNRKILVDTGIEDFMPSQEIEEQVGFPIMQFEDALDTIGWKPDEIEIIIHTHLHNDHCENDVLCTNAEIYVQQSEIEFFNNPHPIDHRYYPDVLDGANLKIVNGDAEIAEGIEVLFTPGHTPGGQSVVVETSKGKVVITGLCCNSENFPAGGGVIVPGVHLDVIQAYDSMKRIKEAADIIVPIHDLEIGKNKVIPGS